MRGGGSGGVRGWGGGWGAVDVDVGGGGERGRGDVGGVKGVREGVG